MSSLALLWPLAACAITGAALYATRGVLDQTATATGVVRFALLPPWQAFLGFTCLAALAVILIDHLNAPRGTTTGRRPTLSALVLPLFALVVLVLPFAPWIPDRWPALQALSGPMGALVWIAVAGLQLWVLWQARLITPRAIERWTLARVTAAIFVATVTLSATAAWRLTRTPVFPGGDEPHYLVIAQSLWRDGDLKIENNHTRGDYREYFDRDLAPHYLTRGADREIYSIHPIGMPVLLAPVYGAGGYDAVVWALILIAATAAAIAWWWTMGALNAPGAATFAWAAIAGSAPFLFNSFTVYPEICAALAVMIALVLAVRADPLRPGVGRWLAIGLACASLPWLSTKYAPMSAVLVLVAVGRWWRTGSDPFMKKALRKASDPVFWAVVAPYALSLAGWFAFFYVIWGTPRPQAPYGSMTQTTPLNLVFGAPGLLFDQEYGLLAFAPVYILAATGLVAMWRTGGELRRQAIEITLIFGALLGTVGAFRIWWGGTAAPARPLASVLLLLALPIAAAFRAAPAGSARRAGQHLLLWVSVAIAITLAVAQEGLLIDNGRDGSSALLEYWSPRWELWALAPSFIQNEAPVAWLHSVWWLAIAVGGAMLLSRWRHLRPGGAALAAAAVFGGAVALVALTFPLLPAGTARPAVDLGARSRLAALDGFDARVRPAALLYDPLRRQPAAGVLPLLALGVKPAQRTDSQPLRVIHNGRFSLPAGTYGVEITFADQVPSRPTPLSLQVGRVGPPLQSWMLQPQPRERWRTTLWLPVDANFVGFRGPLEMERAIAAITLTPSAVVDAGARPRVPVVLSAAAYAGATFFFHNEQMYPEPQGFWTVGRRLAEVTVAAPPDRTSPVVLRIHCGGRANHAVIRTFGWQRNYSLVPGTAVEVELPVVAGGVIPLTIATDDGFSPKDLDPSSTDPRFLGIWVEVMQK
ncbi:MAG: hypothetical protein A3J29_19865 [Acidobacteria bacterium RIFCSPLOWO2_12_FULL_67_14b]|nr:MAG: hypothetical protein A3J29_19865 [Acidobacteria bacterium RIFCSPLOWO2_12_FULL_67_14b]